MAYTLVDGAVTVTLQDTGSKSHVLNESTKKKGNLKVYSSFGSNSNEAQVIDVKGPQKLIIVTGIYIDSAANITTFMNSLDARLDGSQSSPMTYNSDISGSKSVFLLAAAWDYEQADPRSLYYSLTFLEGT